MLFTRIGIIQFGMRYIHAKPHSPDVTLESFVRIDQQVEDYLDRTPCLYSAELHASLIPFFIIISDFRGSLRVGVEFCS